MGSQTSNCEVFQKLEVLEELVPPGSVPDRQMEILGVKPPNFPLNSEFRDFGENVIFKRELMRAEIESDSMREQTLKFGKSPEWV